MKKWLFFSCLLIISAGILVVGIFFVDHLLVAMIFAGRSEAELVLDPVAIKHAETSQRYAMGLLFLVLVFALLIFFRGRLTKTR